MGDTTMRLGSSMGPSLSGEKRCGTANTLLEDEAIAAVQEFRHPLLPNGPCAVYQSIAGILARHICSA
jgi:hypothetical protein